MKRASLRAWGLVLLVGSAVPAFAAANAGTAEPVRVVVVSSGAGDPVAARLIDELIASGVTVEVTGPQTAPLPALGRARAARAVVQVDASRRSVHLWTSDAPATAPDTLVEEPTGDAATAARVLALRVVEVLRPHLVAPGSPPVPVASAAASPAPSTTPSSAASTPSTAASSIPSAASSSAPSATPSSAAFAPSAPATAPSATWPDNLTLYVGPAVLTHPGTALAASGAVFWGVTKMVHPHIGVDVCALVPVLPGQIETPGGTVKISVGALGGGGFFRFPAAPSALTGWLGLGLAAGFVGYDAEAASMAVRASDGVVAHALPYARAAFEWRTWPALGLRADFLAAVARPRPLLEIAGQPDTALEQPLLGVSLGVLVWLP